MESRKFDRKRFIEKPESIEMFDEFIPLIRSALVVIMSPLRDFNDAINGFRAECLAALPLFRKNKMYIAGYLGGLCVLGRISDKVLFCYLTDDATITDSFADHA